MSQSDCIKVMILDHTAKMSGGEVALLRTLAALDRDRFVVHVVLGEDGSLVAELQRTGHMVTVLPLSSEVSQVRKDSLGGGNLAKLRQVRLTLVYGKQVGKLAKEWGANLIHTNSLKSDFYGIIAARTAKVPLIWHIRDTIDSSYLPWPAVLLIRKLAKAVPQFVITNSYSTWDSLQIDRSSKKVAVVYDGLELDEFKCDPSRKRSIATHVALIGRISAWKGQDVFIRAAATTKNNNLKFSIVGKPMFGEEGLLDELKNLVKELGVMDRVSFVGFVDNISDYLADVDILVHASTSAEPFGQVIIEGMATGTAVIASALGGPLEIITSGENGLLIAPGQPEALAEAIETLVADNALREKLAAGGRKRVEDAFLAQDTVLELEHIYDRVAGRSAK